MDSCNFDEITGDLLNVCESSALFVSTVFVFTLVGAFAFLCF